VSLVFDRSKTEEMAKLSISYLSLLLFLSQRYVPSLLIKERLLRVSVCVIWEISKLWPDLETKLAFSRRRPGLFKWSLETKTHVKSRELQAYHVINTSDWCVPNDKCHISETTVTMVDTVNGHRQRLNRCVFSRLRKIDSDGDVAWCGCCFNF